MTDWAKRFQALSGSRPNRAVASFGAESEDAVPYGLTKGVFPWTVTIFVASGILLTVGGFIAGVSSEERRQKKFWDAQTIQRRLAKPDWDRSRSYIRVMREAS